MHDNHAFPFKGRKHFDTVFDQFHTGKPDIFCGGVPVLFGACTAMDIQQFESGGFLDFEDLCTFRSRVHEISVPVVAPEIMGETGFGKLVDPGSEISGISAIIRVTANIHFFSLS
jgi:hypothetical protein